MSPATAGSRRASPSRPVLCRIRIAELVPPHRGSFAPCGPPTQLGQAHDLAALNSGAGGDRSGLESFAAALGPALAGRDARLFLSVELAAFGLKAAGRTLPTPRWLVLPLAVRSGGDGSP